MKSEKVTLPDAAQLRKKAEEQLKNEELRQKQPQSEVDHLKLLHELEVHQVELEMQMEELRWARDKAEIANERFNALYDFAPAGYFTIDRNSTISELNFKGAKMLGTERSYLINKRLSQFIHLDTLPVFHNFLNQAFDPESKATCEVRLNIHGETSRYLHLEGMIFENELNFLVTAVDITSLKKIEQALRESQARLHELNATKDKFFSIIAHDLKNPFNAILGFGNLLVTALKEKSDEQIERYATIMLDSSQRAMDLLLNLLDWSRSQSGTMEFNPQNIDVLLLIGQVTEMANATAQQKSITIYTELPDNATIFGDPNMLTVMVSNLVSNAVKFTRPGGEIVVSVEEEQNKWKVSVKDNGVGIKKEALDRLFRMDSSYKTSGTNDERGTGLGLLLCKEFVEKHGGRIWVESEVGKGSKFCFTIPKQQL